ncbi:MAG: HNH endonuclease signature motif containing protein [Anaerolineae bacterium]
MNEYIPKPLRERVAVQAQHRCGYCLTSEAIVGAPMEIDHIVPRSLGGLTKEDNLWLACSLCNEHKGIRTVALDPLTGEMVPLFNPRRQAWQEHFAWTAEGDRIIGLTAIGRATVVALNLNRPSLVKARQVWVAAGWHPPKD